LRLALWLCKRYLMMKPVGPDAIDTDKEPVLDSPCLKARYGRQVYRG